MWHGIKGLELMIIHQISSPSSGDVQGREIHLAGGRAFWGKDTEIFWLLWTPDLG